MAPWIQQSPSCIPQARGTLQELSEAITPQRRSGPLLVCTRVASCCVLPKTENSLLQSDLQVWRLMHRSPGRFLNRCLPRPTLKHDGLGPPCRTHTYRLWHLAILIPGCPKAQLKCGNICVPYHMQAMKHPRGRRYSTRPMAVATAVTRRANDSEYQADKSQRSDSSG